MTEIHRVRSMFQSRLDTLSHLLRRADAAYATDGEFLSRRLAPDMHPFGTQIAFTCNQPRNFALWCAGKTTDNLDPHVTSLAQARKYIDDTKALLEATACDDAKLAEPTRVDLGPGVYVPLSGADYINDFLIPNFYFHLVTAYAILRMTGLDLGKADYMQHLLPLVRQG